MQSAFRVSFRCTTTAPKHASPGLRLITFDSESWTVHNYRDTLGGIQARVVLIHLNRWMAVNWSALLFLAQEILWHPMLTVHTQLIRLICKGMWQCSVLWSYGIYLDRLRKYTRKRKIRIKSEILGVRGWNVWNRSTLYYPTRVTLFLLVQLEWKVGNAFECCPLWSWSCGIYLRKVLPAVGCDIHD